MSSNRDGSKAKRGVVRRFGLYQDKRPFVSTLVNYAAALKGSGLSHDIVRRWFNKLVDKDDYSASEKRDLVQFLDSLAMAATASRISSRNAKQGAWKLRGDK